MHSKVFNSPLGWIFNARLKKIIGIIKSRIKNSQYLSTNQYGRIVDGWINSIGLEGTHYGTHTVWWTKPSLIYKKTKNFRACQLLLGHSKLESTVRYLGIEVDDALEISESIDIWFLQLTANGGFCLDDLRLFLIEQERGSKRTFPFGWIKTKFFFGHRFFWQAS